MKKIMRTTGRVRRVFGKHGDRWMVEMEDGSWVKVRRGALGTGSAFVLGSGHGLPPPEEEETGV